MAVDAHALELRLIRRADGVDLDLLPLQGLWTEEQYLALTNQTNHLIELTDGEIEVLARPTSSHQIVLLLLYDLFRRRFSRPVEESWWRRSGCRCALGGTANRIS